MDDIDNEKNNDIRLLRRLGVIGIGLTSVGGALLAAPIVLPGFLITVSNFMVITGTIATVLSRSVLTDDHDEEPPAAAGGVISDG